MITLEINKQLIIDYKSKFCNKDVFNKFKLELINVLQQGVLKKNYKIDKDLKKRYAHQTYILSNVFIKVVDNEKNLIKVSFSIIKRTKDINYKIEIEKYKLDKNLYNRDTIYNNFSEVFRDIEINEKLEDIMNHQGLIEFVKKHSDLHYLQTRYKGLTKYFLHYDVKVVDKKPLCFKYYMSNIQKCIRYLTNKIPTQQKTYENNIKYVFQMSYVILQFNKILEKINNATSSNEIFKILKNEDIFTK